MGSGGLKIFLNKEQKMQQLTKEQAIELAIVLEEQHKLGLLNTEEAAAIQLFQERLCMPFEAFHKGIESLLGRPVFTHTFGNPEKLREEYLEKYKEPTMDDLDRLIKK